jgi:hypothetical protein
MEDRPLARPLRSRASPASFPVPDQESYGAANHLPGGLQELLELAGIWWNYLQKES